MDNPVKTAEAKYISQWKENAKQHYEDGDYNWLCSFLRKNAAYCRTIAEVGCGAGYSTLAFKENGIDVISFDINEEAITATQDLLEEHNYNDVSVSQADIVHQLNLMKDTIISYEPKVDMIVLCNPGGNVMPEITNDEYKLLTMFGFTEDEIAYHYQSGRIHLLHKWAMIYGACSLATLSDKVLLIVERGNQEELNELLDQIQIDTGCRNICRDYRKIDEAPETGVKLNLSNGQCYWGAAIYYPM